MPGVWLRPTWGRWGHLGRRRAGPKQPGDDAAPGRGRRGLHGGRWGGPGHRGLWRWGLGRAGAGAGGGHGAGGHHGGLGARGRALPIGRERHHLASTARLHHLQEAAGTVGRRVKRVLGCGHRMGGCTRPCSAALLLSGSLALPGNTTVPACTGFRQRAGLCLQPDSCLSPPSQDTVALSCALRGQARTAEGCFPASAPTGPSGRPDAHVIVLLLRLLLHRQLLQCCIHVQLVGLQLPQQRLPLWGRGGKAPGGRSPGCETTSLQARDRAAAPTPLRHRAQGSAAGHTPGTDPGQSAAEPCGTAEGEGDAPSSPGVQGWAP